MDIIKKFESNDLTVHVTVKGTLEEPLFRASDIGEVLEITHIRTSIQDFDNTEKHGVHITDIMGRSQETTFLTEKGLYKLLFKSRKPIAKKFTDWVCEVIKEIRLKGKYQLEQKITEVTKDLDNTKYKLLTSKESTLLETYENSRGIYLSYIDKEKRIVKFGHGIIGNRVKMHKKEIGEDFCLQYIIETQYDRELEQLIKNKLKNRIISKNFPNRKAVCTELIKLTHDYTIENLHNDILKLKKTIKDDLISSLKNEILDLKRRLSKYESENTDTEFQLDEDFPIQLPIQLPIEPNQEPKSKKKMPLALTEKLKKKVYKFCIEPFNLVAMYNSIIEAAKEENISPITLSRRISIGSNINGFIWSFSDEKPKEFFCTKNTIVYKYDSDLNLLNKYPSIAEAARQENIETTKLQRLCRTDKIINGIIYSKKENLLNFNTTKPINSKIVNKIDVNTGEVIKTYKSLTEAAKDAGVNQSAISRRIKNNTIIDEVYYELDNF